MALDDIKALEEMAKKLMAESERLRQREEEIVREIAQLSAQLEKLREKQDSDSN